jgi:hypothetical protein
MMGALYQYKLTSGQVDAIPKTRGGFRNVCDNQIH